MKFINYLFIVLLLSSCDNEPKKCQVCDGTGKVYSSYEDKLKFELINTEWLDNSNLFSKTYNYEFKARIKNIDVEPAEIKLVVFWSQKSTGIYETHSTNNIIPGETKTIKSFYTTRSKVNEVNYKIISPLIIRTDESICRHCLGRGFK